ncbi:MAG: hypothetical protein A2014_10275 [Spirochaetes bacterium GWF1_49_6]|nr:MAG: hypothetical protein A2014_10275 [Spirochaetes bacterium GWF1_49_6]
MKKILIGWFAVLITVIALWNTGCSDGIFGQTDMMKLVTNWEMTELVLDMKITYIGTNTNDLTNYSVTNSYNRITNTQVFYFRPYSVFEWAAYSNDITIGTDSGSYIVNQFSKKITLYLTNSNLQVNYGFGGDGSLSLSDFRIVTSNTNVAFYPLVTNDLGGGSNQILTGYHFKFVMTSN